MFLQDNKTRWKLEKHLPACTLYEKDVYSVSDTGGSEKNVVLYLL